MASEALTDNLAALLRNESIKWSTLQVTPEQFVDSCRAQDLTALIHSRIGPEAGWPSFVRELLAERVRIDAVEELLRRREIIAVLDALAAKGVSPILFKGTPLAYEVYEAPHLRPRCDTDFLIPRAHVEATRRVLESVGYSSTVYCGGELLFCQFEVQKRDEFGIDHALDVHWKISTQSVFADVLTYEELDAQARPIPALGPHARGAGLLHALLLACLHPVMHHRNDERLIWMYDAHVLASRLSRTEFDQFVALATSKRVLAICAHVLAAARARFNTCLPEPIAQRLKDAPDDEPTAVYLLHDRRWHHELSSNLRGLRRWRDRVRLLREVLFPAPSYMQRTYGLAPGSLGTFLLPMLYLHRGLRGGMNVLAGRK
ncbi:MAG: nucleotidyltransferase family protein [Vicinamibacterales bacterium]